MTEVQKDDFGSEEDQEINSKSRKKMKISKTISKTHAFDGRRRVDVSDKDTLNHRRYLAEKNEIKLVYNLPKKPIQPALAWAYGDGSSFLKAKFPNMRSAEVMAYANEEFPQHAVRAVRSVPAEFLALRKFHGQQSEPRTHRAEGGPGWPSCRVGGCGAGRAPPS